MKTGILSAALVGALALGASGDVLARETKSFTVDLDAMNNSGVQGTARVIADYDAGLLTVMIMATGLEPNALHPQHIHGFIENTRKGRCPTMAADVNGDNLVDLGEGLPFYGPILLSLEPFPTAPDGTINFVETYALDKSMKALQNRVIVLHGMTVGGAYWPTLPVACGTLDKVSPGRP
jgi:hypothetical protein